MDPVPKKRRCVSVARKIGRRPKVAKPNTQEGRRRGRPRKKASPTESSVVAIESEEPGSDPPQLPDDSAQDQNSDEEECQSESSTPESVDPLEDGNKGPVTGSGDKTEGEVTPVEVFPNINANTDAGLVCFPESSTDQAVSPAVLTGESCSVQEPVSISSGNGTSKLPLKVSNNVQPIKVESEEGRKTKSKGPPKSFPSFQSADFNNFILIPSKKHHILLVQLYDGDTPSIKTAIIISKTGKASITVHQMPLDRSHDFWFGLSERFTNWEDIKKLTERGRFYDVCPGNYEDRFTELPNMARGLSVEERKQVSAYLEGDFGAVGPVTGLTYTKTVRSSKCALLVKHGRKCNVCSLFRAGLRKAISRQNNQTHHDSPQHILTSSRPNSTMSKDELVRKIEVLKRHSIDLDRRVKNLEAAMDKSIGFKNVKNNPTLSMKMLNVISTPESELDSEFQEPKCYQRLFWEQQRIYNSQRNKKSMKWHPAIIKWCLDLQSKSSVAFNALKNSGFIALPSKRTLSDYNRPETSKFKTLNSEEQPEKKEGLVNAKGSSSSKDTLGSGSTDAPQEIFKRVWKKTDVEQNKNVTVRDGLVYDATTGEIVGYEGQDQGADTSVDPGSGSTDAPLHVTTDVEEGTQVESSQTPTTTTSSVKDTHVPSGQDSNNASIEGMGETSRDTSQYIPGNAFPPLYGVRIDNRQPEPVVQSMVRRDNLVNDCALNLSGGTPPQLVPIKSEYLAASARLAGAMPYHMQHPSELQGPPSMRMNENVSAAIPPMAMPQDINSRMGKGMEGRIPVEHQQMRTDSSQHSGMRMGDKLHAHTQRLAVGQLNQMAHMSMVDRLPPHSQSAPQNHPSHMRMNDRPLVMGVNPISQNYPRNTSGGTGHNQ